MRTDRLDHRSSGRRIVIDTKFTSILKSGWYRAYLYQIYTYLRSQTGQGDSYRAEGMLLYPSVGESVAEAAVIQGHRIRFMTVNLAADTSVIRAELLRVTKDRTEVDI